MYSYSDHYMGCFLWNSSSCVFIYGVRSS